MKSPWLAFSLALSLTAASLMPSMTASLWAQTSPTPNAQSRAQSNRPGGSPSAKPVKPSTTPSTKPAVQASGKPGSAPKSANTSPNADRVKIYADKAIYKRQEKKAEAIGHVKIIQDNTTIYADKVLYNEATKQSTVDDGVKIVQVNKTKDKGRTTTITATKMTAFHQDRRLLLKENVRMNRDAVNVPEPAEYAQSKAEKRARTERAIEKARTVITSEQMEYFTRTEDANLDGKVVLLQKDKQITGDKAIVRGKESGDMVVIEGNAQVTQINGNWLIKNKIIKPEPEDEEQQRMLREKLVINADKITFFRSSDDLKAEGNVKIVQKVGGKERVAVGKEASYSEAKKLASLIGAVKIQRENQDWLTSDKALFYTDKDTFEAIGTDKEQVVSEFTLPDEASPSPKEPINSPLPEFDLDQHQPSEKLPAWLRTGQKPQRAPAETAQSGTKPAKPSNKPRPNNSPGASPKASGSAPPSPKPSAKASPLPSTEPSVKPSASPSAVASSFIIETN